MIKSIKLFVIFIKSIAWIKVKNVVLTFDVLCSKLSACAEWSLFKVTDFAKNLFQIAIRTLKVLTWLRWEDILTFNVKGFKLF